MIDCQEIRHFLDENGRKCNKRERRTFTYIWGIALISRSNPRCCYLYISLLNSLSCQDLKVKNYEKQTPINLSR